MSRSHFILAASLTFLSWNSYGKDKHPKKAADQPQDQIDVVAHLPLTGGAITGFLETQHYRRNYLYVERESGKTVSLIDITTTTKPTVLAEISSGNLIAVVGNAALVGGQAPATPAAITPQTFRIMSFADPVHPVVKQQFDHVTAMAQDEKHGLIFLANDSGVWILQQRYAVDPEDAKLQKEIERSIYDTP